MRVTGLLSGLRNDPLGAQNGVKLRFFVPLPVCALYLVRQFYSVFFALGLFSTVVGAGGFCEESFLWVGGKKVKRERERERKVREFLWSLCDYLSEEGKKVGGRGRSEKKTSEQSSSSGGEQEQRDAHPFGFPLFGLSSALRFYSYPPFFFFFPADERKE